MEIAFYYTIFVYQQNSPLICFVVWISLSTEQLISTNLFVHVSDSLLNRRFQKKHAKGNETASKSEKWGAQGGGEASEGNAISFLPIPSPFSLTPSPPSPIFCSPRTCSFARPPFRLLVQSSHGKGKEKAVTQVIIVLVRCTTMVVMKTRPGPLDRFRQTVFFYLLMLHFFLTKRHS